MFATVLRWFGRFTPRCYDSSLTCGCQRCTPEAPTQGVSTSQGAVFVSGTGTFVTQTVTGTFVPYEDHLNASQKSLRLLKEWLSEEQLAEFNESETFHVIGGDTGTKYKLHPYMSFGVYQFNQDNLVCRWCFSPAGVGAIGDIMLAQKIALERYELEALKAANVAPP